MVINFKRFIIYSKTPLTLQEGEDFGRGEKFFHFACFDKVEKKKQADSMVLS